MISACQKSESSGGDGIDSYEAAAFTSNNVKIIIFRKGVCNVLSTNVFTYKSKDGKTVIIREAKEQDTERMLDSASRALINAPYMLSTVEDVKQMSVDAIQKTLKAYYENPNYVQFIAEVDGKLVGAIDFKNGNKEKISHQGVFAMNILPEYRNHGIGRALLETLINWAKNNSKIEKVCLEVMEDNLGAIKLYKNLGFFEEGRKTKGVKLDGGYQDLILMALVV